MSERFVASRVIYHCWYDFLRIAMKSTDKEIVSALARSKGFYAPWEVKVDESFDRWWKTHKHLFLNMQREVTVLKELPTSLSDESLYVEIPKGLPHTVLLEQLKTLLQREDPSRRGRRKESAPTSLYVPTETQALKHEHLRVLRDLTRDVFCDDSLTGRKLLERTKLYFESERFKRKKNKIPSNFLGSDENSLQSLRRYKKNSQLILLNVANGIFPGKQS